MGLYLVQSDRALAPGPFDSRHPVYVCPACWTAVQPVLSRGHPLIVRPVVARPRRAQCAVCDPDPVCQARLSGRSLGAALGVELWIKRDEYTGLAVGANRVRQLELHLGEAQARGADTVLVTGAVQSNLVRVVAAGARRLGMDAHVQLEERVDGPDAPYRASGNLVLDRLLGATLHAFPVGEDEAAADAELERRAWALAAEGRRPHVIHSAPGHPSLGGLGYVLAAEEVTVPARALGVAFDAVVCASGSGLTHAGLQVGLRALDEAVPVYGMFVRRDATRPAGRVAQVAAELAGMIGRPAAFDAGDVEVSDAAHAPGYGRFNDAVGEAMALAARREALLLDPVYTGKAVAGLVAHVRSVAHRRRQPGALLPYRRTAGAVRLRGRAGNLALEGALGACGLTGRRRVRRRTRRLTAVARRGRARSGPRRGLVQDPLPERPHLRPLPGGRRGDEAAALRRPGLSLSKTGTSVLLSSSARSASGGLWPHRCRARRPG